MHDVPIPPDKVQDPFEKNVPGKGVGRDGERTPMQWSAASNAGFSAGDPWLPIAADSQTVNVEAQRSDPASMLSLYSRLIALRRAEPALEIGRFEPLEADGDLLAYLRRSRAGENDFMIVLNLGSRPGTFKLPESVHPGTIALSTYRDRDGAPTERELKLCADEGLIARVTISQG
jgi:alpha-glucosidase